MKHLKILLALLAALNVGCASKTASYYYAQKQIEKNDIDFHKTLRVDEYLNAFDQDWLKVPDGKAIVLRVDPLSSKTPEEGNKTLIQVAVKTRKLNAEEARKPIGISFVVDVSGSMSGEKIRDTKDALKNSILELKNGDVVSLVIFNNDSQVVESPATINKTTRQKLLNKIAKLEAGGGTNIESGLIAGYRELAKLPKGMSRRLLMLTDGNSTVDAKTPGEIAKMADVEYLEGLRISTIGLGYNVDEKLLRKLAEEGKGHYYFADTSKTLTRILREDLQTTIVPIAKEVNLTVDLGGAYELVKVHGATPDNTNGKFNLALGELNANDWRILILELNKIQKEENAIKVEGSYYSLLAHTTKPLFQGEAALVMVGSINPYVLRNSILYGNAEALIKAGQLHEEGKPKQAIRILELQLNNNKVLASIEDSEMLQNERSTLLKTRNIIAKEVNPQIEPSNRARESGDEISNRDNGNIDPIIRHGSELVADSLPGVWSTIARLLIFVIL